MTHAHRRVGERYDTEDAGDAMMRYLAEHGLEWLEPQVLRIPADSGAARGLPGGLPGARGDGGARGGDGLALDLGLLWAVATLVRPELAVELGTRDGVSTRTLAHALAPWGGTVVTADPVNVQARLAEVPCQFVNMSGEELFDAWTTPVPFMFIDTDPHSYRQTRMWLDRWVQTWLADGGVAVFHDVVGAGPRCRWPRRCATGCASSLERGTGRSFPAPRGWGSCGG